MILIFLMLFGFGFISFCFLVWNEQKNIDLVLKQIGQKKCIYHDFVYFGLTCPGCKMSSK